MTSKRKSYTTEFKLEVIKYAENTNNYKAAEEYSIHRKTVQDWKKLKSELGKY